MEFAGAGILGKDTPRALPGTIKCGDDEVMMAIQDGIKHQHTREQEEFEREVEQLVIDALIPLFPERWQLRAATFKKYRHAFERFKEFCAECGITALPTRPGFVASYIWQLVREGHGRSYVGSVVAAIKYAHHVNGFADPTASDLVRNIVQSLNPKAKANGKAHGHAEH